MFFRRLAIIALGLAVSACASAARVDQMVPAATASIEATSPLAGRVCVKSVTGGEETNPLWTSEVDNTGFRGAIEGALQKNGMAAPDAASCALGIEANLLGLAQPIAGFSMEVTANVNYSVLENSTSEPWFQSTVVSPYTAEFSSAFLGVERLRIANEGAIRTNIAKFLEEMRAHAKANPPPSTSGAEPSS